MVGAETAIRRRTSGRRTRQVFQSFDRLDRIPESSSHETCADLRYYFHAHCRRGRNRSRADRPPCRRERNEGGTTGFLSPAMVCAARQSSAQLTGQRQTSQRLLKVSLVTSTTSAIGPMLDLMNRTAAITLL